MLFFRDLPKQAAGNKGKGARQACLAPRCPIRKYDGIRVPQRTLLPFSRPRLTVNAFLLPQRFAFLCALRASVVKRSFPSPIMSGPPEGGFTPWGDTCRRPVSASPGLHGYKFGLSICRRGRAWPGPNGGPRRFPGGDSRRSDGGCGGKSPF